MKRVEEGLKSVNLNNIRQFTWEEINEIAYQVLEEYNPRGVEVFIKDLIGSLILLERGECIHGKTPDNCSKCRK